MSDIVLSRKLGFQVISNLRNIKVHRSKFEQVKGIMQEASPIFVKYGLEFPSDEEAFNRAVDNHGFGGDVRFDRVKGARKFTMNLRVNTNDTTTWQKGGSIELVKDNVSGSRFDVDDMLPSTEEAILARFEEYKNTLITPDVSKFVDRVCKVNNAVSLRDSGGIWFVPISAEAEVRNVINVVRQLTGYKGCLSVVNMDDEDTGEHRQAVRVGLDVEIEKMLKESQEAMDDYMAAMDAHINGGARMPQGRVVVSGLREIKAMEEKLSMYRDLLDLKTTGVDSKLKAFKDFWTSAIGL